MLQKSKPVIFGLLGHEISSDERKFFSEVSPLGFILFARNIDNPMQVKKLVNDLKKCVGWECPVLIDQEGGRVARLKPPHWRKSPPIGLLSKVAESDMAKAEELIYLNARLIGRELYDLGINVDCAPVCDLLIEGAHDIVGDRSFGDDVKTVSILARKMSEGLIDSGVLPIIKHIPGHGRAKADSHKELPIVKLGRQELAETDFKVFKNLSDMPWAMTAHILYTAIDEKLPATLSTKVIGVIRNDMNFDGVLISDDLSMEALQGSYAERARGSLAAGCDVVLHCNGKMDEMTGVAEGLSDFTSASRTRVEKSLKLLKKPLACDFAVAEEMVQQVVALV